MIDQTSIQAASLETCEAARWPAEVQAIFARSLTAEYATLTARELPVTFPVTPYVGQFGATLDISTGLAYPAKAERARRNPQVALLFSDPTGSGLTQPPTVLVQGLARVRDADLQDNTERYVQRSRAKMPETYAGVPPTLLPHLSWYLARIWVEITPTRICWWPEGRFDREPQHWAAPVGTSAPPSDPAPQGPALGPWKPAPTDWKPALAAALRTLPAPVLTVRDAVGFPLPMRVRAVSRHGNDLHMTVPAGMPTAVAGAACLTFHHHPAIFSGQQNVVFVGQVHPEEDGFIFTVDRQLGDWSLAGNKLQVLWSFLRNGQRLARRVHAEARRRNQAVPVIRS